MSPRFLLLPVTLLALASCTPPEGAAVMRCETPMQMADNPWKQCTLAVDTFHGRAAATFDGKSPGFYRYFEAETAFRIEQGKVRVTVRGQGDPVVFTVEPKKPWQGTIVARLNDLRVGTRRDRKSRGFIVTLEPEGEASGLHATIRHHSVNLPLKTKTTVTRTGE